MEIKPGLAKKFLWVGLTMIMALNLVLSLIGLSPSDVLPKVGAVIMVIGAVLLVFDK